MKFPEYLAYEPKDQRSIGRLVAHVFHPTSLTMTNELIVHPDGQRSVKAIVSMGQRDDVHALTRWGLGRKVDRLVKRNAA